MRPIRENQLSKEAQEQERPPIATPTATFNPWDNSGIHPEIPEKLPKEKPVPAALRGRSL